MLKDIVVSSTPIQQLRIITEMSQVTPKHHRKEPLRYATISPTFLQSSKEEDYQLVKYVRKRKNNYLKEYLSRKKSIEGVNKSKHESSFNRRIIAVDEQMQQYQQIGSESKRYNFSEQRGAEPEIFRKVDRSSRFTNNHRTEKLVNLFLSEQKEGKRPSLPIIIKLPGKSSQTPPQVCRISQNSLINYARKKGKSLIELPSSRGVNLSKKKKALQSRLQGWRMDRSNSRQHQLQDLYNF